MKSITEREQEFRDKVFELGLQKGFPKIILAEFSDYWTEPNKSGKKMRWEQEKTWDLSRRINRWANNDFGGKKNPIENAPPKIHPKPKNEIEELDEALREYQKHPATFEAKDLAKWYNLLVREQLIRKFTKQEVADLKERYGSDPEKGKGICVMMTFDSYTGSLLTFEDILKSRK